MILYLGVNLLAFKDFIVVLNSNSLKRQKVQ
jgi:hypothetical protein